MPTEQRKDNNHFQEEEPAIMEIRHREEHGGQFKVREDDLLYLREYGFTASRLSRTYKYGIVEFVRFGDEQFYHPDTVQKVGEHSGQERFISLRDLVDPDKEELHIRLGYSDGIDRGTLNPSISFSYHPDSGILKSILSLTYDSSGNQVTQKIDAKDPAGILLTGLRLDVRYGHAHRMVRVQAGAVNFGERVLPLLALRVPLQVNRKDVIEQLFPDKDLLEDPFFAPAYMDRPWLEADLERAFSIEPDV